MWNRSVTSNWPQTSFKQDSLKTVKWAECLSIWQKCPPLHMLRQIHQSTLTLFPCSCKFNNVLYNFKRTSLINFKNIMEIYNDIHEIFMTIHHLSECTSFIQCPSRLHLGYMFVFRYLQFWWILDKVIVLSTGQKTTELWQLYLHLCAASHYSDAYCRLLVDS